MSTGPSYRIVPEFSRRWLISQRRNHFDKQGRWNVGNLFLQEHSLLAFTCVNGNQVPKKTIQDICITQFYPVN